MTPPGPFLHRISGAVRHATRPFAPALFLVHLAGCTAQGIDLSGPPGPPDAGVPEAAAASGEAGSGARPCSDNADCRTRGGVCDPLTKSCVECLADGDCLSPWAPRCDTTAHSCFFCFGSCDTPCVTDAECVGSGSPLQPSQCDETRGVCVQCRTKSDCNPLQPLCDEAHGVCVQCLTTTDCQGTDITIPHGDVCSGGYCVGCASDQDCARPVPYCERREGRCVECVDGSQCGPGETCDRFQRRCVPGR